MTDEDVKARQEPTREEVLEAQLTAALRSLRLANEERGNLRSQIADLTRALLEANGG